MAETTQKDQLSGAEIIEAVVDKLRTRLRGDCYLNQNSAYDWFTATLKIELDLHDTGAMVRTDYEAKAEFGKPPVEEDSVEQVRDVLEIEAASPNTVRQETGQGIPTLTKDDQGRTVTKHVHYKRAVGKKGE